MLENKYLLINVFIFRISFLSYILVFLFVMNLFWFDFFVRWLVNLCRLFNAKSTLLEERQWCYLTHSWVDKGVYTFRKGICQKVNIIARPKIEVAYYDSAVHRLNHYTTRTPLNLFRSNTKCLMYQKKNQYSVRLVSVNVSYGWRSFLVCFVKITFGIQEASKCFFYH